jgi:ABC-type glycerol-3-phosphate transport system substrate-binding protein
MMKKLIAVCAVVLLAAFGSGCSKAPEQKAAQNQGPVKVGPVRINPHPASLAGKTVVLRWNSKFNGDKFLDRVAELLAQKAPGVKVVKMYQVDPSTAVISENADQSLQVAQKIADRKPDIVIAAQAD